MQYILIRGLVKNFKYIPVVSNTWSSRPTEALDDEAAKKPPGEAILTALTDADMEALDSILDSNALPGSAFIEVALEPVLDEGLWNVKDFLQAPTIPILSSGDTSSSWWCLKKAKILNLCSNFSSNQCTFWNYLLLNQIFITKSTFGFCLSKSLQWYC